MNLEQQKKELQKLVDLFAYNLKDYKSGDFNETNTRQQFIDKFFELLGRDVNNKFGYSEQYKEVVLEDKLKIGSSTKAPDYSFRLGGRRIFFVEAKNPSINIKEEIEPAYQIRRYSWTAKLPIGILTDFEELAIYDTRIKPNPKDKAGFARIAYFTFDQYIENWEWIYNTLSKEAVMKGALDKYISESKKSGTLSVDVDFLNMIDEWRDLLAKNIYLRYEQRKRGNRDLDRLNWIVGDIVDKIIFLRIAEDKQIEEFGRLENIAKEKDIWKKLIKYFELSDKKYNSGLFDNTDVFGKFELDDKVLKTILTSLYYPACPYEFSVLGVDILGNIYEKFLGKTIIKEGRTIKTEFKPDVKKAGGVFYTPQYIVDYIVKNTVGELLKNKTPKQALDLKIADPACGSGAFLIGAYDYILNRFLEQHTQNEKEIAKAKKESKIYQYKNGHHLSFNYKSTILTSMVFGVDIDRQAVAVSKLSLLLKLLEGETDETTASNKLFGGADSALLPDLQNNIKCGNSLVDSSIYESLDTPDEETIKKINAFDREENFKNVFVDGGFDIVIGNPPYIKEYTNREIFEQIKMSNMSKYYQGKMDFWYLFASKGLDLLKNGGLQGFIAPNNWISNAGASKLRQKISQESKIKSFVDFVDFMVFQNASIQTMVYILENKTPTKKYTINYTKILDGKITEMELSSFLNNDTRKKENDEKIAFDKVGITISEHKNGEQITFVSGKLEEIIEKIKNKGNFQLSEKEVAQGIVGAPDDEYLVLDKSSFNKEEKQFIKKFYTNTGRYYKGDSKNYIIYLTNNNFGDRNIKDLPNIYLHFEPKKKKLQEARIKLKTPNKPYYFLHRERDESFFLGEIIIGQIRVLEPSFYYSSNEYYGSRALNFIKSNRINLKYLIGILNSKLICFWLKNKGKLLGKLLQIDKGPLLEIPIAYQEKQEQTLINLVDQMLLAQQRLREVEFDDDKQIIQKQIEIIDRKIDDLVFDLYGLTDEERKIVLNS